MNKDATRRTREGFKQFIAALLIPSLLALQLSACGSPDQSAQENVPSGSGDENISTGAGGVYSGETIFKGAFFGMGPVAQLVPEIWTHRDLSALKAQLSSPEMATKAQAVASRVEELSRVLRARGYDEATAAKVHKIAGDLSAAANSPDELAKLLDKAASDIRLGNVSAASAVAINRAMAEMKAKDATFFDRFGAEIQSGDRVRVSRALQSAGKEFSRVMLRDSAVKEAFADRGMPLSEEAISSLTVDQLLGTPSNSKLERDFDVGTSFDGCYAGGGGTISDITWVNDVQVANEVQAINFVQVSAAALFVVAAVVYIAALAVAAVIAVNQPSDGTDALQGDLLVNSLAVRLRPPSGWKAGRVYAMGDFVQFGNRPYQAVRAHTAQPGAEPNLAAGLWVVPAPAEVAP